MAHNNKLSSRHVKTTFVDEQDIEFLDLHYREDTFENDDGSVTVETDAQNRILASAEAINAAMLSGPNRIVIGLCGECRSGRARSPWARPPKTHGLHNIRDLKACPDCGHKICPQHRTRSTYDRQERCPKCHRRHRWRLFLQWIFFESVDE